MPTIKRDAVYASIRSQLMNEPQKGTMFLLNILKLFADRKDDGEFVKEIAELASELAAMESPYPQPPLFAQPVPMPYLQNGNLPNGSIPVPSFADFNPGEPPQPAQRQSEPEQKPIANDALSALNQMGEDTAQFTNQKSSEPVIEGYEEWKPKNNKNKSKK